MRDCSSISLRRLGMQFQKASAARLLSSSGRKKKKKFSRRRRREAAHYPHHRVGLCFLCPFLDAYWISRLSGCQHGAAAWLLDSISPSRPILDVPHDLGAGEMHLPSLHRSPALQPVFESGGGSRLRVGQLLYRAVGSTQVRRRYSGSWATEHSSGILGGHSWHTAANV